MNRCQCTCSGGVGRLEEAHHSLGVEARRAQQDGLGPRVPPADDGEAILTVAATDPLDGRVRDALRHDQQAWVAVAHACTHTHTHCHGIVKMHLKY